MKRAEEAINTENTEDTEAGRKGFPDLGSEPFFPPSGLPVLCVLCV
jgi:hypothetical protein